jgi:hypothetical protein
MVCLELPAERRDAVKAISVASAGSGHERDCVNASRAALPDWRARVSPAGAASLGGLPPDWLNQLHAYQRVRGMSIAQLQ